MTPDHTLENTFKKDPNVYKMPLAQYVQLIIYYLSLIPNFLLLELVLVQRDPSFTIPAVP